MLAAAYSGPRLDILIDQGQDDQFLSAGQLLPDNLIAVCSEENVPVVFRLQEVSSSPRQSKTTSAAVYLSACSPTHRGLWEL